MTAGQAPFSSPQQNGYLAAFDGSPMMMAGLIPPMGQFSAEGYLSDHSEMQRGRSPRGRRGSSKPPEDPTDPKLMEDIPGWLRSLRLHKYTDNLKDLKMEELIQLDDKALEARGVNALGARNKLLKVRRGDALGENIANRNCRPSTRSERVASCKLITGVTLRPETLPSHHFFVC